MNREICSLDANRNQYDFAETGKNIQNTTFCIDFSIELSVLNSIKLPLVQKNRT